MARAHVQPSLLLHLPISGEAEMNKLITPCTALLLVFAQATSAMPPMATNPMPAAAPSHAQMQQEIDALRMQVQQLQQAHDMPMGKMDKGMGMGMKPGMGMKKMPDKAAKPPAAPPMKKGGMGMEDDAMEMPMPPADPADPAPMPHM